MESVNLSKLGTNQSILDCIEQIRNKQNKTFQWDNLNIIILEDDSGVINIMTKMLKNIGIHPIITREGRETLEQIYTSYDQSIPITLGFFDLIIAGGMGGYETLQHLQDFLPNLPIIAMSGYTSDPIMKDPTEYGFFNKMEKPFSISELYQIITLTVSLLPKNLYV
ncbi:response regulator [Candidatus Lokiarchaeum ossiferum]|uniref:response regulator n=1 Tax=Candidatus Lokiarchaeum ossiferum TaxID=2951803 RepID=UPI00352C20A8